MEEEAGLGLLAAAGGFGFDGAVRRAKSGWVWWWPAVVWMTLIFIGSTDLLSDTHTSRFLAPLLRWLFPGISELTIEAVRVFVRKTGHVAEYAGLAYFIAAGWQRAFRPGRWRWRWSWAGGVLAACLLYAVSDEWHQSFVPSRLGCGRDVLIDLGGAAAGLFLLWVVGRLRRSVVRGTPYRQRPRPSGRGGGHRRNPCPAARGTAAGDGAGRPREAAHRSPPRGVGVG